MIRKEATHRPTTRKAALSKELFKLAESIDKLADSIAADAEAVEKQMKLASRREVTDYGTASAAPGGGITSADDFMRWCVS